MIQGRIMGTKRRRLDIYRMDIPPRIMARVLSVFGLRLAQFRILQNYEKINNHFGWIWATKYLSDKIFRNISLIKNV